MFSIASRRYDSSRSRLSGVVLLAALLVATPGVLQSQRRVPTDTPRDSNFWQRFLAAVAEGLAARDTSRPAPPVTVQRPVMPDVVGMDTTTALRRLGLPNRSRKPLVTYVIERPSPTLIPVDRIAAQLPAAGDTVRLPLSVRLTLAGVPRPTKPLIVPPLIGLLEDSAAGRLRALGLVEDRLEDSVTAADSIGRVTGQNPPAGRRIAVGGTVSIAIGQDARVYMPDVTGVPIATARERLRAVGIDVRRVRRDSVDTTSAIGLVVRQSPVPKSVVGPTTRIVLTQAVRAPTPPPPPPPTTLARTIEMPDLVGHDSASATRTLRALGLRNYRIRVPWYAASVDTVHAQSPAWRQTIRATDSVVLTLRALDPVPLGEISSGVDAPNPWLRGLGTAGFVVAVLGASMLTARRIWPPPQIVPRIRLQPMFTDIVGAHGSLVGVSVSLRSHVEHERSELDLTGSSLD